MSGGGSGPGALVSSARNPRVQRVRKLGRRSFRDREKAFLLEGPVPVGEALRGGYPIQEVFLEVDSEDYGDLRALAEGAGIHVVDVSRAVMETMSDAATPQGVVAVADMPAAGLEDLPETASLVLVLAGVADPGNAGTLLRSALAAGADGVVFLAGSVDPFGPKTVRASAGTVLRTLVVRDARWEQCRSALKELGLKIVGTAAAASVFVDEAELTGGVALIIGNEASGLPPEVSGGLDETVSIPMPGPVESLNAAVAGSILLFEVVRQTRADRARGPVSSDDG